MGSPFLTVRGTWPTGRYVPPALTCLPPRRCTAGELTRWRPGGMQQGRQQPCRSGCRLGSAAGMLQPQLRRSCVWACCTTARCGQRGRPRSVAWIKWTHLHPVALRATTTANGCDKCRALCCAWPGSSLAPAGTSRDPWPLMAWLHVPPGGALQHSHRLLHVPPGVPLSTLVDSCRPCPQ